MPQKGRDEIVNRILTYASRSVDRKKVAFPRKPPFTVTETLALPEASVMELPGDLPERLRQCPRVLLFGHSHNLYKIAFVTERHEILPVLLKEGPDQEFSFSPPNPVYVTLSARAPTCSLVTSKQARHLLSECSYFMTDYPDPVVFQTVLDWLS